MILAACFPVAAFADAEPGQRRVLTIDEQPRWSGVGRLNHSGGGFCSGALIAPDTVLTAAHCVIDRATNRPAPATDLRFVAGLRTGVYTAHRRAVSADVHPDWAGYSGDGRVQVSGDIALVRLETPITDIEAARFSVGPAPDEGEAVTLVSYGRGREGALSIQEPCHVVRRYAASLELNCNVINGASGAPVFNAKGEVVAVISAGELGAMPDGSAMRSFAVIADGAFGARAGVRSAAQPTGVVGDRFRSAPSAGARLPGGKRAPAR